MSSFGFTFLSRKALGQAEQLMFGGAAGVHDEVGFLIVHQRYADHFFPGTSVLHTRLRYVLLIPWLYQSLRTKRPVPKDFGQAFSDLEHELTGRLKYVEGVGGEKDGVMGGEVFPGSDQSTTSLCLLDSTRQMGADRHPPGWPAVEPPGYGEAPGSVQQAHAQ